MKSLKRINLSFSFLAFALLSQILPSSALAENMISDQERELIMFFSFECGSCHIGMLAMNYTKKSIGGYQRMVPIVTDDISTHKSAALYFMMKLTQSKHQLSESEMVDIGFQLYPLVKDENLEPDVYMMLFKKYGLQISLMDFLKAWEATYVMMGSAKELTQQVRDEKKTFSLPLFRVTYDNETRFVTPDFEKLTLAEFKDIILSYKGA